jgi:hypothetical protein
MMARIQVMTAETGESHADDGRDFVFILSITQHWTDGDDVTRYKETNEATDAMIRR